MPLPAAFPLRRRHLLFAAAPLAVETTGAQPASAPALGVTRRPLVFPRDFGSHPDTRTEWWYMTGWLQPAPGTAARARPSHGFQLTFFRTRGIDLPADHPSRFAARQIAFAHMAVTEVDRQRLRHDQRIARMGFGVAEAALGDTQVSLRGWTLRRSGPPQASRYEARLASPGARFALAIDAMATQPVLLQGDAGYSRKGPGPGQASHYYSQPQLAVSGELRLDGATLPVRGTAWLDHEWSESVLDPAAVGWDWIGMNLFDGSALTAFRVRRGDGSTLWSGGSWRARDERQARVFSDGEAAFTAGRRWSSPRTRAAYPVEWVVATPTGRYTVQAWVDDQELAPASGSGTIYWEGLSRLLDETGREVGRGYLEMTGYAGVLRL